MFANVAPNEARQKKKQRFRASTTTFLFPPRGARAPRRAHVRPVARAAMTFEKAFACAMCGARARMTCGGCAGFAYCAEACLRSHWASGHAEACARVERDVAATAAVRAAHDVDALAWWRVAVVHVDEGLATACDALGECHGVGAFRRECGCFRRVPFGSLPQNAADDDDDALEGLFLNGHTPTLERRATKTTTGDVGAVPARTWLEMYARLGFAKTSRAALVFSAAATTVAFCEKTLLAKQERRGIANGDGGDGRLVIHVIGAEKELDQASYFAWFLSRAWRGEAFRESRAPRDVEVHMVGPEVPRGFTPVERRSGDDESNAPRVTVYGHRGLYHDVVDATLTSESRGTLLTAPDVIVCPDAGIAAFTSWVPTIDVILRSGAPAVVTDLTAEAARLAAKIWRSRAALFSATRECVSAFGSDAYSVALNPFRRVMSARGNDTQAPTYANGFGFQWVPGVGVEPL